MKHHYFLIKQRTKSTSYVATSESQLQKLASHIMESKFLNQFHNQCQISAAVINPFVLGQISIAIEEKYISYQNLTQY